MEMTTKEWNSFLDTYLITGRIELEDYQRLTEVQLTIINEVKKAINRIKNKS